MNISDFEKIKLSVKSAAEKAGLKEYELYFSTEECMGTEALKDEISSFSFNTSGGLSLRSVVDGKMGSASSELVTDEAIEEMVLRARDNAKVIESDDVAIIFKGSEKYAELPPVSDELPDASAARAATLETQKKMYAASDMVTDGTQSGVSSFVANIYLYNSYGLELSNKVSNTYTVVAPVISDGKESVEGFELAKGIGGEAADEAVRKAFENTAAKLGAGKIKTGKYNVVFSAEQMRAILSTFSPVFSAKNAMLGLSLLAGKEGKTVASEIVNITDDAIRSDAPLKTPFDGEGVATYRKDVIKNGKLETLLYDLATADKAGKKTTANGHRAGGSISIAPYCFCLEAGEYTLDGLFELAGNGIYITEMKGFHAGADAVTGDFSIECEGFKIENGKKTAPIKTFTVAGNFFEFLKNISALSDKTELPVSAGFTVFGSPAALIRDMSVAGE